MRKPLKHLLAVVDLAQHLHELLWRCLFVASEPCDDFLVHLAVPVLIATVRLLILRSGLEALIPRSVDTMQGLMLFQLFGNEPGDDVVFLALAVWRLVRGFYFRGFAGLGTL